MKKAKLVFVSVLCVAIMLIMTISCGKRGPLNPPINHEDLYKEFREAYPNDKNPEHARKYVEARARDKKGNPEYKKPLREQSCQDRRAMCSKRELANDSIKKDITW